MVTGSLGPFPGGLGMDLDFVSVHEAEKLIFNNNIYDMWNDQSEIFKKYQIQ